MDWFLFDGDLRQERVKVRGYLVREYFNIKLEQKLSTRIDNLLIDNGLFWTDLHLYCICEHVCKN